MSEQNNKTNGYDIPPTSMEEERNSGYDIPPSNLEEDCHPPMEETTMGTGSYISRHHANISDMYNAKNPLVTGLESSFNRNVSLYPAARNNEDVVPEMVVNIYEGYKVEIERLETFYDWPSNAVVKKEDLARNGFIYTHTGDRTQCVFCRGILSGWEEGDIVQDEHKKHCPECMFAYGYECGNVPLNPAAARQPTPASSSTTLFYLPKSNSQTSLPSSRCNPSYNTTVKVPVESHYSSMDINNRPDSRPSDLCSMGQPSLPSVENGRPTSTDQVTPRYSNWGEEYKRIRSFRGWPTHLSQTPIELAKAGLLYMGNADRVKCFWCGGELFDWEPQDDPWEEHAKWFPHCGYVRGRKGDQYIQYVKDKQNGLVVDPPVQELMKTPHVLAVLAMDYTPEQVEEVFNRYGRGNLIDARAIVRAIEETKRARQAILRETNNTAGMQETGRVPSVENMITEDNNVRPSSDLPPCNDNVPRNNQEPGTGANNDVEKVLLENEKLKDMKLCKICLDKDLCMTFLPCGHLATCEDCSISLVECPICRKEITQRVKVFWS